MRTIIVDDDVKSLELLKELCQMSANVTLVGAFTDPMEALCYAQDNYLDFALLDIVMPGMNGIELSLKLREKNPKIVVIFTSSHKEYYLQAINMRADFYMLKPYRKDVVEDAIERAYFLSKRIDKRLEVSMIKHFIVMLDGQPVRFTNAKARELLALCMDHGGGLVTKEEIVDKLWPNREYDKNAKKLVNKAENYLKHLCCDNQLEGFFCTTRQGCYIDPSYTSCDYYDYVKVQGRYKVPEDYLAEFEWSSEY